MEISNDKGVDCNSQSTAKQVQEVPPEPPSVDMEFDTFDDGYEFYNSYAKYVGFGIRIKNSWYRKLPGANEKERYHVVLSCSSEGFKKKIDSDKLRPDMRTGCDAFIRLKLLFGKWKVTEVLLEHNHMNSPSRAKLYKSHKKVDEGTKRKLEVDYDAGIRTNFVYKKLAMEAGGYEKLDFDEKSLYNHVDKYKKLQLKEGDAQAIYYYFRDMQLKNPNFFYLMDLNDDGQLRNVFWADGRSRTAYEYFGDVIAFDTTYLTNKFDLRFAPFVGVNHHGQSILLGCGLLADEKIDSFVWLFNALLSCMSGRAPSAIITDQCQAMRRAILEVFPNARHRLCLWHIMDKVPTKLKGVPEYAAAVKKLYKVVYNSLRIDEFKSSWKDMSEKYQLHDHEWLQTLYEDRERWVPVYLRGTFFAGMSTTQRSESMNAFFDNYVNRKTTLREFVSKYDLALHKMYEKEAEADRESRHKHPVIKTRYPFELQISQIYTTGMFKKFQNEVEEMASCFNITQVRVDGKITTYIVKERFMTETGKKLIKEYEVWYNTAEVEVECICNWFNFKGYLCRHALSVLHSNGVDEILDRYILSRWRKDFKRTYVLNKDSEIVGSETPIQWYAVLYKRAIKLVEEGVVSKEHYKVALEALEEATNKVRHVEESGLSTTPTQKEPSVEDNFKVLDPLKSKTIGRPKENRRISVRELIRKKMQEKEKHDASSTRGRGRGRGQCRVRGQGPGRGRGRGGGRGDTQVASPSHVDTTRESNILEEEPSDVSRPSTFTQQPLFGEFQSLMMGPLQLNQPSNCEFLGSDNLFGSTSSTEFNYRSGATCENLNPFNEGGYQRPVGNSIPPSGQHPFSHNNDLPPRSN